MSTYNVRIWKVSTYKGKRGASYTAHWSVDGNRFRETFQTRALAESFRSKLMSAAREGVPFDEVSGLPEPMMRELNARSWYEHAVAFVDMKWPHASARHRQGIAEALTTATLALLTTDRGRPSDTTLRKAMTSWAFNKPARKAEKPPAELAAAIRWLSENTVRITTLNEADVIRRLLDHLALTLKGTTASPSTIKRKKTIVSNALRYAVELRLLDIHPFTRVRWKAPKSEEVVDRRVVVNPVQARKLLAAVQEKDPDLEAFFACMYYAALRPSEVIHLRRHDLTLPEQGWGELHLTGSTQETGAAWSDTGKVREDRELKHRSKTTTRPVPACPELVTILRRHLDTFGPAPDGRLFVTRRTRGGGKKRPFSTVVLQPARPIGSNRYTKAWSDARQAALTSTQANSPLAGRPYDLRHAAVSFWLNAGVDPAQIAEWAGHSIAVLMRVYAKCIDGGEKQARRKIEDAFAERQEE